MRGLTCVVLLFAIFTLVTVSPAQPLATTPVPNLITYSGTLIPSSDIGVPAKTVGVTFAIYRQEDGGAPIWLETQNVTADSSGHYSVLLGSTRAEGIPADLFSAKEERWLGVQVQGEAEQPRVLLVSVPYVMKAADRRNRGRTAAFRLCVGGALQWQPPRRRATAARLLAPPFHRPHPPSLLRAAW